MSKNNLLNRLAAARTALGTVEAPAKVTKKAKAKTAKVTVTKERKAPKSKAARKTTNRKPVANGTIEGHKCLVQKNRQQFLADHDWAQPGTSTKTLAQAVIAGAPLTGVWAIGPKTVARLTGVEGAAAITVESQGGTSPKASKKGKKGGRKAAKVVEVTAEPTPVVQDDAIVLHADGSFWRGDVRVTRTGKVMSEAQIAAADAPRRADGKATPKREWALRETLADTGKHDAHEIDTLVAEAVEAGLI